MSIKEKRYYNFLLKKLLKEIYDIENNKNENLIPSKKQLDLLEKSIEFKKIKLEIAIIDEESENIKILEEEIINDTKKLAIFSNNLGYNFYNNTIDDSIRLIKEK